MVGDSKNSTRDGIGDGNGAVTVRRGSEEWFYKINLESDTTTGIVTGTMGTGTVSEM